jgi:ribose 5-phosphate isomerase B
MKIAVGNDHAGFDEPQPYYKPAIVKHLQDLGHEVIDCGTYGPESVDYPDFADKVAEAVTSGRADRGVLLCGTGIGISIAANRHAGVRAAVVANEDMARLAREHNDANVIALGRRILPLDAVLRLIDIWLETPFSAGERHQRRVDKLG